MTLNSYTLPRCPQFAEFDLSARVMNEETTQHLADVFSRLDRRNDQLGLARHDPSDVNAYQPFLWLYGHHRHVSVRWVIRFLKLPELIAPRLWRKLLRIPPSVAPTSYHHLGRAYWHAMNWDQPDAEFWRERLTWICQQALQDSLKYQGRTCWGVGRPYRSQHGLKSPDLPCAHTTARVGSLMLLADSVLGSKEYLAAALDSAMVLCEQFRWHSKPNGQLTVSYWPDTDDEVINIASDVAILLANLLAASQQDELFVQNLAGLVRMIISEQGPDGQWFYGTADYNKLRGFGDYADSHHTGMVIYSLLRVLESGQLEPDLAEQVVRTVQKGLAYYCEKFFGPDGMIYEFPTTRIREASVVGYSEAAVCLCDAVASRFIPAELASSLNLADLACAIVEQAVRRYVDKKHWDVASYRYGNRRVKLRSIRWGSGALMEATSHILDLKSNEVL